MVEQRRFLPRAALDQPLLFTRKGAEGSVAGIGKDISLGGMFIETDAPAPFNAEIVIVTDLGGTGGTLTLPAVVRWTKTSGMGVQFRLLGARETHIITELTRASATRSG